MALLAELVINGETFRVSNESLSLTHYWDPYVDQAGSIKWAAPSDYGGYVEPKFSNFSLLPKLFESDWPSPSNIGVTLKYTDSAEEASVILFNGEGHTSGLNRESNEYELFGKEFTSTITSEVFDDTLIDIFTTYTGTSYLNLTLDSSAARSPSPAVKYTATGETILIKTLSDIAKFFSHSFYIIESTLYLVDLLADNGTETLTEFDFSPVQYRDPVPVSIIRGGIYYVLGSSQYGEEIDVSPVCHDTQANIETALGNIKTIVEARGIELSRPMTAASVPVVGKGLTWIDESFGVDLNANFRTNGMIYNFDNYQFVITGRGTLT